MVSHRAGLELDEDLLLSGAAHAYKVHLQHELQRGEVPFSALLQRAKQAGHLPLYNLQNPGRLFGLLVIINRLTI